MTITASLVKELRDRTNAGMMECKKALVESGGDIEKAIEMMRVTGQAKAVKKAARTTADGTIVVLSSKDFKRVVMIEVNCETDFVAREGKFQEFAKEVGQKALQGNIKTLEALQQESDQTRLNLITQLGENITLRRLVYKEASQGIIGTYAHGDASVRIGTLVVLKKGPLEVARDLAMHVAAMRPEYITAEEVPEARLLKEKEIFMAQTREKEVGKPEAMIEKIVAGKLKKFATEVALLEQPFVKDPAKTVRTLLKEVDAAVETFVRFEVGEGIEKKEDNFVSEVMAQVKGS